MSRAAPPLLPAAALLTALAAGFALAASGGRWPAAALWHLVFAVGALPMILLAMAHFVPVLTRGAGAPEWLAAAPLAAWLAGLGIVGWFAAGEYALRLASPWLALAAVAVFAAWLAARWRAALGRPHPGLAWYAAALGLIAAGLLAIAFGPLWPEQQRALRLFHLHINTLGFIGLTALGTLQVLLPTVAGRPDAEAAVRLRRDLAWSCGGAVLIALGAAMSPLLVAAGTAAYAWPLLRLMGAAWRNWRAEIVGAGTTLPLLAASLVGLLVCLGHGALHAARIPCGADATGLFVVGFLLPLLSGAAGHLLPVWLRPGVQGDWHRAGRRRLAAGARLRAVLFVLGGVLVGAGQGAGYVVGAAGALWLVLGILAAASARPT